MKEYDEKFLIPYHTSLLPKGSAIVFAPHPDDEVFGCGGAIIRHIQQGDEVKVVIVTDGGFPVSESQKAPDYPETRKKESIAAAEILEYGRPEFLDFKDGFLQAEEKLITRLFEIILHFQPQNIYLPADSEIHPEHLALNKAAVEAVKRIPANINLFFYEIGQPLTPNFLVDITDLQPRLDQAMDCFSSQLAVQDYNTHIRSLHAYRAYTLGKNVKFAEAYRLIRSNKLKTGEQLWQQKPKMELVPQGATGFDDDFPLISVIVRTMNRPELPEALESISLQTYPNIEVIVVDARGEKPLDLGDRHGKFPLRVISKGKPLNRPEAANAGLDAVKGEYFCFLDEDDLYLPEQISTLHHTLLTGKASVSYSVVKKIDIDTGSEMLFNAPYAFDKLLRENYIPNLALLFRSDLLKKGCRFDQDFGIYEDWDFLIQAAQFGDFLFIEIPGGIYRNYQNSGVHTNMEKVIQFRRKMYLKWISLISDDKFMALIPRNFDEIKQELITEKKNIQDQNDTLNSQIELLRSENNHLKAEIILIRESLSFRIENKLSGFYHRVFYNNPLLILKRRVSNSRNLKTIKESGLFDEAFYLNNNPDVKESGSDALTHYLKFGGFEGRDPSESFDSAFYYEQNPDVKAANLNPLLHYLMFGKNENRIIKKEIIQPPLSIKDRFLIQKQAELSAFIQSEKYIDLTHPQPQVSVILVLFNKAELTLACLTSLRDYSDVQMEIIIVDNNSTDLTIDLLKKVKVTRVIYHPENRRYLEACNQAMEFVSTPYILFLNNDTEISRGSISTALKMMIENDEYGAVGAKLILPDGTLQEAGNIIWRDGSCDGYGRGDSPDLPEYNFRRIVDYCSGAFLLTRTELIKKYGGFDPLFAPAYYEETDYCLWIQAQGFHVIYDPNVVVRHFEFGSSDLTKSVEILKINLEKFAIKHKHFLAKQFESGISNLLNARFAASQRFRHKILYVDDGIPHPAMGMGFRRSHAIVHSLEKLGFLVTLYPNIFFNEESLKSCYQDISPSIEIILNYGHQRFPDFINERKDYYDFVWISKPHNMQCNYEHLVKYRNRYKIIYNPADILTEKIMAKAKINADQSNTENYGAMPDTEIDLCKKADIVVAISEIDAASLRGFAINNVYVLGHTLNTQPGQLPFEKRKNLLFVGNLDNEDTPNVDSSRWFVNEVLPLVKIITYPDPAF